MSRFVLTNVRLFPGGVDLTSVNNKAEVTLGVEEKPVTNFGSDGWKEILGGIRSWSINAEGQWEAGDAGKVDDATWSGLGGVGAWSVCPHTADVGAVAWTSQAMRASYTLGDKVGEVAPWKAKGAGSWPLARGTVLHAPGTARSSTGTGTATELAAVASGQYLYGAVHVLSASGTSPSLTVTVESDADNTFASATSRLAFAAATGRGSEALRVAGPVTDTWFRVSFTISGTTPSFLFLTTIGIA